MATYSRRRSRLAAWFLSFLFAGCAGGAEAPRPARDVTALFQDDVPEVTRLGAEDDPVRSFSRVAGIAVSPDGSRVVVLDGKAPFVRLFQPDGTVLARVPKGEGPGEARSVQGVAAGPTGFLVLGDGIKLFGRDGDVITEGVIPGAMGLAAVAGCGNDWFVYGPGPATRGRGWLRSIHISPDSFSANVLLTDTTVSSFAMGATEGLSGDGARFVLFQKRSEPAGVLTWTCADPEPRPVPELDFLVDALARPKPKDMGGGMVAIPLPVDEPTFGGMVRLGDGVLWVERVMIPAGPGRLDEETRLHLVEGGAEHAATVQGSFTVYGAAPGGTVWFGTYDPWPQVLLIDAAALKAALESGPRRSLTDAT